MQEFNYYDYEAGSAAVAYAEAVPIPERVIRHERELERQQREEEERHKRIREHKKAMRKSRLSAFRLVVAMIVFGGIFSSYIYLQNSISQSMRNISRLESDISELRASNAATESRISTTTNLNAIKWSAINEMGMKYADNGQIVYYELENQDYMSRYNDIK